jgi:DNA polymerase-1
MYSKHGFNFEVIKDNESGKPSTDEETLTNLRLKVENPESPKAIFLDKLLELRGLEKMYKTYIYGWWEKVQDDSRLHGRYNIHGTDSNRFSSADPNMQQIPKTSVDPNIKKQLVAPPGYLYMAFDYSQAELRMMAHLSGDETYLEAFAKGVDPHLGIAAAKYGVPIEEASKIYEDESHPDHKLWKVRRKQAKQIAFGLIYGIGDALLAVKLSDPKAGIIVSKEEARKEMDEFFKKHPKILKFKEKQEKFLRKNGYYTQLFGTKRRLPQIYSNDKQEVAYAIRLGLNFPCQGAAANMTNFGAILVYWLMRQGKLPMMKEACTVHDAVYMYSKPQDINTWTVYTIWNILRNPSTKKYFGFQVDDVDMDMDFTIGRSMAEELPFIPGYDYNKMLQPDFSVEEYMEEHKKYKHIHTKQFKERFNKQIKKYEKDFERAHGMAS